MDEFKETLLAEPEALSYFRESLGYGHTLSRHIFESIDLENGEITTYIPENANMENIYSFKWGGLIPESPRSEWHIVTEKDGSNTTWIPIKAVLSLFVETIRSFLSNNLNRICIIDDTLAKSTDPGLRNVTTRFVTFRNEVYHLITPSQSTNEEIETVINWAGSIWPPLVGVLTSLPGQFEVNGIRKTISLKMLKAAAEKTIKIIVGAYDGEGYLIWSKN